MRGAAHGLVHCEQAPVDWVFDRRLEQVRLVGGQFACAPADHAKAFMARGGREPGAEPLWILDPVEVLDQAQPGGLCDVRCVRARKPVRTRGGPHQPGETVDDRAPGCLVPVAGGADQRFETRGWA